MKVPMSSPDLGEAERQAVAEVLHTPRLSMGPQVEAFEAAMAKYVGARYAIAVSSGTAALHLCVRAAGVQDGDLVITTPFSFVASANVLLYERAVPVFVDVDPTTGNLDPGQVSEAAHAIQGSTGSEWLPRRGADPRGELRAILAVDVFGQPADYHRLLGTAEKHQLALIEDASEALGAQYHEKSAGTLGDAAAFAFYPNKQLTTGEGGMVGTEREDWAERVRALRNQGRAQNDTWLQHTYPGYNYRLDEMSAALGRAQAERLDELLAKRDRVAGWYKQQLQALPGIELAQLALTTTRMSWFVYIIRLDSHIDRAKLMAELEGKGIPSRAYFEPIHLQPYMLERFGFRQGDFPVAEDLGRRSLALPFSGVMTQEQVSYVSDGLRAALGVVG
ncbi:MAG: DegT/DnrJ/EryC1/StrS family aminotransferase [Chloroflexota bacterium]